MSLSLDKKDLNNFINKKKWHTATLKQILPVFYGKSYSKKHGYACPETPVFGSNGSFKIFDRALTKNPAIVIGRKGSAGSIHYSLKPCWPIDTTFYTEGNKETYLPFFRYLLENLQLVYLDRSTAIPSLSRDDYNGKTVQYPESLREQRRIVAKIEEHFTRLEAGVAALQRAKAQLKRYRASVLKAACEGRLVPTEAELAREQCRDYETGERLLARVLKERRFAHERAQNGAKRKKKYKEPVAPDTADLPELPEGWAWASLGQPFLVERGKFSVRPRNDPRYYTGTHPFVQIGDLPREGGNIETYLQTLNNAGLAVSKKFSKGSVLIAIVGATIANTGILTFDSCAPDSIVAIQSECVTMLKFAEFYLRSIKMSLRNEAYASGGQPNINLGTLQPLPIPFPPLAEQRRIVAEVERLLSVADDMEETVDANLKRAQRLRQAILQRAFSGQL